MGFYECTPAEMADIIKSEIKRCENEDKSRAVFAWYTAYLTGLAVNCPRSFPDSPVRAFPFIDGVTSEERSKREMRMFMQRHNAKLRGRDT